MTPASASRKLPVPKVLLEAFALPWRRRHAFSKALAVPGAAIVATQIGWYLASERLSIAMHWAAWALNGILWVLFAVACHRIVLLQLRAADVALVLPAAAVDARTSLATVWRQARGNGWRMALIVGGLPWAFGYASSVIWGDEPGVVKAVLVTLIATALLAVEVSALSLSYQELAGEGE